jgi:hypothetical protein
VKNNRRFTSSEIGAIRDAARAVWHYIGDDVLMTLAAETGTPISQVSIQRAHVLALVLDAKRTETELQRRQYRYPAIITQDLIQRMQSADLSTLINIVKPAFLPARYRLALHETDEVNRR